MPASLVKPNPVVASRNLRISFDPKRIREDAE